MARTFLRRSVAAMALLIAAAAAAGDDARITASKENTMIGKDVPAGNIQVVAVQDRQITLDVEQRGSETEWFYWKFKAVFPAAGAYDFRFVRPNKIGPQGPAISVDQGKSWRWTGSTTDSQTFRYVCGAAGEEVWFCQCIPYLQGDFDRFCEEFAASPAFGVTTLCQSRHNRRVELVTIKEGEPEYTVLLTARHHAGESMASYAVEGFMRAILADTEFARNFRRQVVVSIVPFVDKDGVEEGDQGKARAPHDHARDYGGQSLYPEVTAIRTLVRSFRPDFVLDLHCPWIRNHENERIFIPGPENVKFANAMELFGALLEKESPPDAPYFRKDNIPFGVKWNTGSNYGANLSLKHYCEQFPFIASSQTIEIPFANAGDCVLLPDNVRKLGEAIARATLQFLQGHVRKDRAAVLPLTGDIMANREQNNAGKTPTGYDYHEAF